MALRRKEHQKTTLRFQKEETKDGNSNPDFDTILEKIGEFGWTQRLHMAIMCYAGYCRALIMVAIVFLGKTPNFYCKERPADDPCSMNPPCDKFLYNTTDNFTSIVTELANITSFYLILTKWDLVCDRKEYTGLTQSAAMFGFMLGTIFLSPLADQHGRWLIMVLSHLLMLVCHLTAAYSATYHQFTATRFVMGFGLGGTIVSSVWVIENFHSKWRSLISIIHNSCFAVGTALLAGLAYCFRDWRDLTFYSSCCMIPFVFLCRLIPESPRWLLSKGRVSEAEQIFMDIGRQNGKPISRDNLSLAKMNVKRSDGDAQSSGLTDVFRSVAMRRRMMILMWVWPTCVMVYYGLAMGASNLEGNMYINVAATGLLEIPATLVTAYLCNRYGRKSSTICCTLFGAVGCMGVVLIPRQTGSEMTQYRNAFAMIAKIGISSAFTLLYIYTGELLPTVVRGSALGLCSTIGRVGGIIGPVISSMGETFAYQIYGWMSFVSCILCLALPETLNKALPETIQDVEQEHESHIKKKDS